MWPKGNDRGRSIPFFDPPAGCVESVVETALVFKFGEHHLSPVEALVPGGQSWNYRPSF